MKISVITPSIRPDFLEMVGKCLKRQTLEDFEWIVCSPFEYKGAKWLKDRPKAPYELYSLNKAFNDLFTASQGQLIVSVVDGIWFPPDTLERFWTHYLQNPKALVTTIGHQYKDEKNNTYENEVWHDPRARSDQGTFYEVAPTEMELCVASIPKKAVLDCGGMDEIYDKGAAIGEKEMCWRLDKLGYTFFIDQTIVYKALHHERLSTEWDKFYKISSSLFSKHMQELKNGQRVLNVGYVSNIIK